MRKQGTSGKARCAATSIWRNENGSISETTDVYGERVSY